MDIAWCLPAILQRAADKSGDCILGEMSDGNLLCRFGERHRYSNLFVNAAAKYSTVLQTIRKMITGERVLKAMVN